MPTARARASSSFPDSSGRSGALVTVAGVCDEMDPPQVGSLIIAADKRILDGFEATTTKVDWKSYICKRVVRSSLVGIHQSVLFSVPGPMEKPE